ncbi:MAG: hypothetical protein KGJ23_04845 [Euryarchaeota archaeon]|nr:hypothetical protein [Euryarchaeota archaeon]MDE1835926.1 hypothetical protein [Euryarchaeota archaeon]MDE1880598.1 hypothetical protein [Euryarchaeota archaeon]MDE2044396.1 hypothetical protein [Thermoplasmata archaeon]
MVVVAQVHRALPEEQAERQLALSRAVDRASAWSSLMERLRSSVKEREERHRTATP